MSKSKKRKADKKNKELPVSELEMEIVSSGTFGSIKPSKELNELFKDMIRSKIKDEVGEHIRQCLSPYKDKTRDLTNIIMNKSSHEDICDPRLHLSDIFSKKYIPLIKTMLVTERIEIKLSFDIGFIDICKICGSEICLDDFSECHECKPDDDECQGCEACCDDCDVNLFARRNEKANAIKEARKHNII